MQKKDPINLTKQIHTVFLLVILFTVKVDASLTSHKGLKLKMRRT